MSFKYKKRNTVYLVGPSEDSPSGSHESWQDYTNSLHPLVGGRFTISTIYGGGLWYKLTSGTTLWIREDWLSHTRSHSSVSGGLNPVLLLCES